MTFRVAFDLDGVLADMESELVRQSEILFGRPATPVPRDGADHAATANATSVGDGVQLDGVAGSDPAGVADSDPAGVADTSSAPRLARLQLSARQVRRLWRHVESIEGFWESLSEIEPGAVARLAALAAERRWEVIFLTKRPETAGATAQLQSQRWLVARGFPLPSVFVVHGSRGRVADSLGLDVVVDDRPENCFDVVVDSKARAVLVWREDENELPARVRRLDLRLVQSVDECLDILSKVDGANRAQPDLVGRLMVRLGLKEPSPD
jgi:hypothetical protein